jgi:chorismate mutase
MNITEELPATVEAGRARLDEIDAAIRELIARRSAVSRQVQTLRTGAGGARIEHSRENRVISGYSDQLGRPGVALAMAILDICRGPLR